MKLSDLDPKDIQVESSPQPQPQAQAKAPLKLSDLNPQDIQIESKPDQGALKAFGEGVANTGTLGYLPEIEAGINKGLIKASDYFTGGNLEKTLGSKADYSNLKQDYQNDLKQGADQHPIASTAGSVAGALAQTPIAMAGLSKLGLAAPAATGAGRVAQAAGAGALQAGLQNPGDTPDDLTPLQIASRGKNAVVGAAIGGAAQGAVEGVNKAVQIVKGLPDFLTDFAENRGAAATGLSKAEAKRAVKLDPSGQEGKKIKEIGRFALDNRLVRSGDTIEDVAQRSGEIKKDIGQKIGDIYEKASSLLSDPASFMSLPPDQKRAISETNFLPKKMGEEFLNTFSKEAKGQPQGREAVNAAKKLVSNLSDNKMMGIQEIQQFKSQLDDLIYKSDVAFAKTGQPTPGIEAMKGLRNFVKDKIDLRLETLDSIFGHSLGGDVKELNKKYGLVSAINSTARNRLSGDLGNNFLSLTDKVAVFEGAGVGAMIRGHEGLEGALKGGLTGAAVGLASKAARTYGRPLMAVGADKLSQNVAAPIAGLIPQGVSDIASKGAQALTKNPGLLGRAGNAAFNPPQGKK